MTVANNRERGLDVEDLACGRWPLEPIGHAHEDRNGWYDLETSIAVTRRGDE